MRFIGLRKPEAGHSRKQNIFLLIKSIPLITLFQIDIFYSFFFFLAIWAHTTTRNKSSIILKTNKTRKQMLNPQCPQLKCPLKMVEEWLAPTSNRFKVGCKMCQSASTSPWSQRRREVGVKKTTMKRIEEHTEDPALGP